MARGDIEGQLGFGFDASAGEVPVAPRELKPKLPERVSAAALRQVWTVRELAGAIRATVERNFSEVWVEGEVSNFRPSESGHLYFTLKDGDAQLRIVMFRTSARLLRFHPENGMHILARGRVTVYDTRGELQITAEYLEPKGAGAIQVAFEQLKALLASEGLFDAGRKQPIPKLPRRIGIVTSPRGAAIQDILNILHRRHEDVGVLIYPAQVQGELAPAEIAAGIRYFNAKSDVDVIIVARGGGSLEDLAAFNDELLARTIVDSRLPTISAVGHETDFTIADFVADLRAPTPSAAAELVIEAKHELQEKMDNLRVRLRNGARYRLILARQRLNSVNQEGASQRLLRSLQRRQQRVDELTFRLTQLQRSHLRRYRQRLDIAGTRIRHQDLRLRFTAHKRQLTQCEQQFSAAIEKMLLQRRARVERASAQLNALSPMRILDRGYALVFNEAGQLVHSTRQVAPGEGLKARVADGEIHSTITNTSSNVRK